jgi:hypothetical protein
MQPYADLMQLGDTRLVGVPETPGRQAPRDGASSAPASTERVHNFRSATRLADA